MRVRACATPSLCSRRVREPAKDRSLQKSTAGGNVARAMALARHARSPVQGSVPGPYTTQRGMMAQNAHAPRDCAGSIFTQQHTRRLGGRNRPLSAVPQVLLCEDAALCRVSRDD